jgi:flagellar biosynthetic protein FlhB
MAEAGERTEKATPKRRSEARDRGQVARSEEVNSTAVLLAGLGLLLLASGHFGRVLGANAGYLFSQAHILRADNPDGLAILLGENLRVMLVAVAPILLAVLVAGLLANVSQVGLHVSPTALSLNLGKLNPVNGMKRFFQKRAFFDAIKNLFKIGLIAWVAAGVVRELRGELSSAGLLSVAGAVALGKAALTKLAVRVLLLLAALAVIDWVFQKWQYEQNLKMSRTETKQEYKDLEGDPQIKARVRHIQLETARRRMLAAVPRADVVVTNPDHFAVALQYTPGQAAPRVVAKGRNHLAETIKRIARESRVPVLENKPLARALYRGVKLGALVPESLYQAVAEVLAYVYRLRKA